VLSQIDGSKLICVDLAAYARPMAVRSRNVGGAIHRVDFRHRVLVARESNDNLSRETEDAAK
jgi:hypothetical protein